MNTIILWLVLLTPTAKVCPKGGWIYWTNGLSTTSSPCKAPFESYLSRTKPDAGEIEASWHGYYTVQVSSVVLALAGTEPAVVVSSSVPKDVPRCPCEGMQGCKCDLGTGAYSYSDGCNTTSCDAFGFCTRTLLACLRDWRQPRRSPSGGE